MKPVAGRRAKVRRPAVFVGLRGRERQAPAGHSAIANLRQLNAFDLALAPDGTPFQREVWRALAAISFGTTISSVEFACRVGQPR